MLEIAYNRSVHASIKRAYNKIHDVAFILRLRKKLTKYITTCPAYQQLKPSNEKPYEELQPVLIPSQPFEVLTVDFVTVLLVAQDKDTIATMTYKYTKYIRVVPGKETWLAEE